MKRLLIAFAALFLFPSCAYGLRNYVRIAEETQPKTTMVEVDAVVEVMTLTFTKKGLEIGKSTQTVTLRGSGVFISPNGHVLSCNHLFDVGEIKATRVCDYYSECSDAELLAQDGRKDLSLLKVERSSPTPYARLADPRFLRVGQEVVAVGNPYGLDFTVTRGIISALNRDLDENGYNLVQTDAPINPGNSGGPLFNMDGELVGINVRGVRGGDGLGFSAESGQIIEFLAKFRGLEKVFKMPKGPWAGLLDALGFGDDSQSY